jgi:cell division transport system permease protein
VVVWLAIDATSTQVDAVKASLIATSGVDQVIYIDKDAAYAEFRELFPDSPEMLASVKPADLPASFRVVTTAPLPIGTVDNWSSIPGVDSTTLNPCQPQEVPPTK